MKLKRYLSLFILGIALVVLAACGQKSTEDIVKTELKDSYVGYSEESGGGYPFRAGDDILTFDKKDNSITNSYGDMKYFSVVSEEDIPLDTQRVIDELSNELEGTDNFTIIVSREKNPTLKDSEGAYQIALSDGGESIRIFYLGREPRSFGYYDFSGKAK
ncbi:TPA: hypothetical protein ACGO97_000793 [Streptococcus suis]|uniref:hypothetical protein n=1 Tax=Streptococcus suis TaxID=1307 RepID=UPI00155629F3|nr:hypothetical protein [Streptococcus suis]NQI71665.1 hypothetical protein [Streptococcus suis]HEM6022240.1 hypothetical protein [Streptococcus suis]HEM6037673.1 hypothetical protein [Streptococcus suis]